MTQIESEQVTFHVPSGTRDNLPIGDHPGYIEWMTVVLGGGHPKRSMARCMLHIERSDYPDFFSLNNSMISMDVNVLADVKAGVITYD